MRLINFYSSLLLLLTVAALAAAQSAKVAITNDDIQQMLSQGLTDDVVVEAISANKVNFDVSPSALLALKKANVSDKVVQAMLTAESKKKEAAAQRVTAAAAQQSSSSGAQRAASLFNPGFPVPNAQGSTAQEVQLPKVTLLTDNQRLLMDPSGTEISSGKGKGGSAAGGILKGFGKSVLMVGNMGGVPVPSGGGKGRGMGMPNVGRSWALPGRNSALTVRNPTPKFEVEFGEIPGVDPDSYEPILLKLVQTKDNWRLVSTSKDKFDKHGNDTRSDKIKAEDKIALATNSLGRGHIIVAPAAELPPGEYGLILHPKKAEKEYAGVTNTNADAIFYSVWDFSVNTAQNAVPHQQFRTDQTR